MGFLKRVCNLSIYIYFPSEKVLICRNFYFRIDLHKSGCLCAVCVVRRKRREREEQSELTEKQSETSDEKLTQDFTEEVFLIFLFNAHYGKLL